MALGFNRTVMDHDRQLHVQIEDLGPGPGVFETRIYEGGQVIFHKRFPHPPENGEAPEARKDQLKLAAEKLLVALTEAIRRGKLPPPDAGAG